MPDSALTATNRDSFRGSRIGAASQVAAQLARSARLQRTGEALRRNEALWISNETPVKGTIVAFHDPDEVDETLVPCFMLPSLPQQSTDFIELAGMMDPRQPFFAAYLPSDKRNAETASNVAKLAQHYAIEIHKIWPTGPIAVGGWSAGPTVALATAEILRGLGHAIPLLAVIDGAPPAVDPGQPTRFEKFRLTCYRLMNAMITFAQFGRDLVRRFADRSGQYASFRAAYEAAWRAAAFRPIWERATGPIARKLAVLMPGRRTEERHPAHTAADTSHLPPDHRGLVTALFDAVWSYQPGAAYEGEVVVFESTAEPARSSGNVAKRWVRLATNVTVVPVKGSHISILADPNGRPLARFLCQKLREVSVRQPEKVSVAANAARAGMPIGSSA